MSATSSPQMSMLTRYVLDANNEPVEEPDLLTWAMFLETPRAHVDRTQLDNGTVISTVFLGFDLGHGIREGAPLLFETAAFGHDTFRILDRHTSWAEAVECHAKAIRLLS